MGLMLHCQRRLKTCWLWITAPMAAWLYMFQETVGAMYICVVLPLGKLVKGLILMGSTLGNKAPALYKLFLFEISGIILLAFNSNCCAVPAAFNWTLADLPGVKTGVQTVVFLLFSSVIVTEQGPSVEPVFLTRTSYTPFWPFAFLAFSILKSALPLELMNDSKNQVKSLPDVSSKIFFKSCGLGCLNFHSEK